MKTSTELQPSAIYSRENLVNKFDITDVTVENGIFKPKNHESVWLFVTEEKTPGRVQYIDHLDRNVLLKQGQTQNRTDDLIEHHVEQGLELLVFHRSARYEHPNAGFRYVGPFNYVRSYGSKPKSFVLLKEDDQQRIYGIQAWRRMLTAVQALGGSATKEEIEKYILNVAPNYNTKNTNPDLSLLTVNDYGRGNFGQNKNPRRTDGYSVYDALFKVKRSEGAYYELYDPAKHGIWELSPDTSGKQRPRRLSEELSILEAEVYAAEAGSFDVKNTEDARKKTIRNIVERRGQPKFRKDLIDAYRGRCAITGCCVLEVLEAAHIKPYMGEHTNHTQNGLLLRGDLHTLFDLNLLRIHHATLRVEFAPQVAQGYPELTNATLCQPSELFHRPDAQALREHYNECAEKFS